MRNPKPRILICMQAALGLILVVELSACSPAKKYQSTNGSSSGLATDVASCHLKASDLMGRELLLDRSYERTEGDDLETSFVKFDARKQQRRYFENCMSQRGVDPVSTTQKK